jgi:hypothetical protein
MRNVKTVIVLPLLITLTSAYADFSTIIKPRVEPTRVEKAEVVLQEIKVSTTEVVQIKVARKGMDHFLHDIGMRESSNRYWIVNRYGYMGKYQFGRKTLNSLGYKKVSSTEFLMSPKIQEQAMQDLLNHNKKVLRRQIKKYEGKVVHGIKITESGLLAAAHLGGAGNVKKFLRRGTKFRDGLGTSITEYMKLFSGYDLQLPQ